MGVSGVVGAATLVGTTSDPTGIDGLVVDGTTYDVAFSTTTLNSFTQGSTLSTDAANALTTALNNLGVTALAGGPSERNGFFLAVDNNVHNTDGAGCDTDSDARCASPWFEFSGNNFEGLGNTSRGTGVYYA